MSDQNAKVLHLPPKPKSGEFLRVRKNDQETIIYTLEKVEGETYLNAHTFMEVDGKLLPTDKTACIPLTFFRVFFANWKKTEREVKEINQATSAVERELLLKGLISPFVDIPL